MSTSQWKLCETIRAKYYQGTCRERLMCSDRLASSPFCHASALMGVGGGGSQERGALKRWQSSGYGRPLMDTNIKDCLEEAPNLVRL